MHDNRPRTDDEERGKEWYVLGAGFLSAISAVVTYFMPAEPQYAAVTWLAAFAIFFFSSFIFAPASFCRGIVQILAIIIDAVGYLYLFILW